MDAERECVDLLNASELGARAFYEVPADRPDAFLVVELTGGPRGEGRTTRPMVDVQCWAKTRRSAWELSQAAQDALAEMPARVGCVTGVNLTSTFRDTDLESGTPRYHVVCEIYSNN